jgi:hypothetical protein
LAGFAAAADSTGLDADWIGLGLGGALALLAATADSDFGATPALPTLAVLALDAAAPGAFTAAW